MKMSHPHLFAAPGGDESGSCNEWVAESRDRRYRGTSFAAAHASGLLARRMATDALSAAEVVRTWSWDAVSAIESYDRRFHGAGFLMSV
jgi:hypothetical protein